MRLNARRRVGAEFLSSLASIVRSAAADEVLSQAAVNRLAPHIVRAVQQHYGGRRIYVTKYRQSAEELGADLVRLMATGKSVSEAAARKGISRATAYRAMQRSARTTARLGSAATAEAADFVDGSHHDD